MWIEVVQYFLADGVGNGFPEFRRAVSGGLQVFFSLMSFNVVLAVIGRLGPESLAASMIALSINNIVFMPLLGISDAASIMVGQLVGSARKKLAALMKDSKLVRMKKKGDALAGYGKYISALGYTSRS